MKSKLTKLTSLIMAVAMLLPMVSCSKSKYTLSDITLGDGETSWSNPEEEYADILERYGGTSCSGTSVVATDKDIIYLYCEDSVEKDGVTKVSQNTVFDIASMSKTFTAICILKLAEEGKLSIDDTIDKYFPEYEAGKNITIYNLLHMSSGISDYLNNPDPFWNISGADAANKQLSDLYLDKTTDEELLEAMYQAPLEFEPGSRFSYSNTNYRLLAFIIEQITGMKYCDYVKANIFDKCGMTNTSSMATGDLTYVPADFDELVFYGFSDPDGYPACPNNSRGDGGIHSCLTDMLAFDRALFGGKLLKEDSMEILLHSETGYCCGLKAVDNTYEHDGASLTCSGNNQIIESEEYGHLYVITFVHSVASDMIDTSETLTGPMAGTNYTKGTFEDCVYSNEYADLTLNLPEDSYTMSESNMEMSYNQNLSSIEDETERRVETAKTWDTVIMNYDGDYIEVDFINRELAAPDDSDYSADDFIDYYMAVEESACPSYGYDVEVGERVTVNLGGNEYIRQYYVLSGNGETGNFYLYARVLDDDLMIVVNFSIWGERSIEEYEACFE